MEDILIGFDTGNIAKEKGFNIPCRYYSLLKDKLSHENPYIGFDDDDYWGDNTIVNWNQELNPIKPFEGFVSRPTQSLLQKWLREVHKLDVLIYLSDSDCYTYHVWGETGRISHTWDTYEEALEEGLNEALKLIKIEKNEKL